MGEVLSVPIEVPSHQGAPPSGLELQVPPDHPLLFPKSQEPGSLLGPPLVLPCHLWVHLPPALGKGHPWPGAALALAAGQVLFSLPRLYPGR